MARCLLLSLMNSCAEGLMSAEKQLITPTPFVETSLRTTPKYFAIAFTHSCKGDILMRRWVWPVWPGPTRSPGNPGNPHPRPQPEQLRTVDSGQIMPRGPTI
eukprot:15438127-Alexandrium_andersonii.AAC.3